jgi:hypothetical protein
MGQGARLSNVAVAASAVAAVLWPVSYAWVAVRLAGAPEAGWPAVASVVGEVGAVAASAFGGLTGMLARSRAMAGSVEHRRATWAVLIGGLVIVLVVGLNIAFMLVHQ